MNCSYLANDSTTTLPGVYIAQVAVLSVAFPLSFIGMVLNIVFICQKKTNFLARRIVYLTVVTTLQLGALWFSSIPTFKRDPPISRYQFCVDGATLYLSATIGSVWMMSILVCSVCFSLVTQLCGCSCCFSRRLCFRNYCLEILLVMITLLIGLVFSVLTYKTIRLITDIDTASLYFFLLPIAIVAISLIGNIILIIWFCTRLCIWRRQITRKKAAAALILNEIGLFKILLFLMFFYFMPSPWFSVLGQTIIASPPFPLLIFGFLWYSFRSRTSADIETAGPGLQTNPPSTRVSLPTDTADHAPNSLSPSTAEPSEVTPLG